MRPLHRFTVLPTVPDALTPLRVLAHNLRWSWHPATQELFRTIDPAGWEASGHNPLRMLNETDAHVLEQAAADADFLARQQALLADLRGLGPNLASGPFRDRLETLLTPAEIDAIAHRVDDLLRSGRFPEPGPGRPYPWPVV
jgi:glucan phosphorylase